MARRMCDMYVDATCDTARIVAEALRRTATNIEIATILLSRPRVHNRAADNKAQACHGNGDLLARFHGEGDQCSHSFRFRKVYTVRRRT